MALKDKSEINAEISAGDTSNSNLLPDNSLEEISPADVRNVNTAYSTPLKDLTDSTLNIAETDTQTMAGDIDMGGSKVSTLADGTAPQDAVNVRQLDNVVSIVGRYSFTGIGAVGGDKNTRDGYYSDGDNYSQLVKGAPIDVNDDGTVFTNIWSGDTTPGTYDPDDWIVAPLGVSTGSLIFSKDGAKLSSAGRGINLRDAYGVEGLLLRAKFDPGALGRSEEPVFGDLVDAPVASVATTTLDAPQSMQFTLPADAPYSTYTTTFRVKPAEPGTLRVQSYIGTTAEPTKVLIDSMFEITQSQVNSGLWIALDTPNDLLIDPGDQQYAVFSGIKLKGGVQTEGTYVGQTTIGLQSVFSTVVETPINSIQGVTVSDDYTVSEELDGQSVTVAPTTGKIVKLTLPDAPRDKWSLMVTNAMTQGSFNIEVVAAPGFIEDISVLVPGGGACLVVFSSESTKYTSAFKAGYPEYINLPLGDASLDTSWETVGWLDFDTRFSSIYSVTGLFSMWAVIGSITTSVRIVNADYPSETFFEGSHSASSSGTFHLDLEPAEAMDRKAYQLEIQAKRTPIWGQSSIGKLTLIYGEK